MSMRKSSKESQSDIMGDFVKPLLAASSITLSIIASVGAGATSSNIALFALFMISSQMIPWLAFRSYVAHNHSFSSRKQKQSLFIGWCLVYLIIGNLVLYNMPTMGQVDCLYRAEYILQVSLAGLTLNHSIRILAILFSDDWFKLKGITTPTQAMFVFNASMIMVFRQKKKDVASVWSERIIELFKIVAQVAIDWCLLIAGARLYHVYQSYIDSNPILYYELSAIYTAVNVDFMVNRVSWINILVYGGTMDFKYGMRRPYLGSSPRDFWQREAVHQREALKLAIFKPIMRKTNRYWLAVVGIFVGNFVVHTTFTAQLTFEYFAFYEWSLIFLVLFGAVSVELFVGNYVLKKMKMEYIKTNMFYKAVWLIVLHVSMALCVYIGVPKLLPLGLRSSAYFLDHVW